MQISPNKNFGSQRTVFKAMPQKEVLQRTRKILQNEQSKKLFVKLSTLAGLTGLVSIVTSFLNKGIKADDSNIEALKRKYNDINNSYLTNPDTVGVLLDITSSSDSKDAEIRTKGATNKTSDTAQSKTITSSIDITPEELEVFLEEANGQKLNTILEQTETLSINPNGEIISKSIDKKITDLAVEAEKLRKEENSSALYNAFAEIAKKLSISSFVEAYSEKSCGTEENKEYLPEETCAEEVVEEKISQEPDKIEDTETEIKTEKQESFTPIVLPENEKVKLKVTLGAKPRTESKFFVMIKSYDKPDTIQIYNTLASIYNEICGENRKEKRVNNNEEVKNSRLVEIISKRVDAIKTLKTNNQKVEIEKLLNEFNSQSIQEDYVVPDEEEKIYTPELFKTEILNQRANSEGYALLAKTFDKYSALICSVYNSLPKENLRDSFLTKLSEKDRSEELNQYIKFGGQQSKLDFMSYLAMVDFKRSQGHEMTLGDFRELESYKDTSLKYSTYDQKDGKVYLYFRDDADITKRFETAVAYFKALYSIKQNDIVKPSFDDVTKETLISELKKKVAKDPNEYENLLKFIGLKLKPNFAGQKLTEEGLQSLIDAQLKDEKVLERFNLVLKALQTPSFQDFVQGTHGRMRFIERLVLDDENITTDKFENLVEARIKNIKREVATKYPIILTKYEASEDGEHDSKKYSPQLKLGNYGKYIIGLNNKGQIHTIYPAKNHKTY